VVKTVGKAVRAAREARGLTLRQVAKAVGMSVPQLSSLESGRPSNPGWTTVVRLARALDMSLDEVAGSKSEKPVEPSTPRAVRLAIERARKDAENSAKTLADLIDRLGKP